MIYKFRRDLKVILTSILAIVGIPIILCIAWFVEGDVEALYVLPFWLLLMTFVILRTPRYFYIEKDLIIVKFFLGRKVLDDIQSIRPIDNVSLRGGGRSFGNIVDLKCGVRTFGNGGLMGYTGYFRSKELGSFQMLAVSKKQLALVTLNNGKKYVINYPYELFENDKKTTEIFHSI